MVKCKVIVSSIPVAAGLPGTVPTFFQVSRVNAEVVGLLHINEIVAAVFADDFAFSGVVIALAFSGFD
jgi:hypothetical protein